MVVKVEVRRDTEEGEGEEYFSLRSWNSPQRAFPNLYAGGSWKNHQTPQVIAQREQLSPERQTSSDAENQNPKRLTLLLLTSSVPSMVA